MPILGLRDTEGYSDFRFKNYRRVILHLYPNGSAPLCALLSLLASETTDDAEFNWYEKLLPAQVSKLTAAYNNTTDVLVKVTDKFFRRGHIIKNTTSGEIMHVTNVSEDGLTLTVVRGKWTTAKAAGTTDHYVEVIGNANAEGGTSPGIISYDPTKRTNYTQIFRTPFSDTGTALKTALMYDKTGPFKEKRRDALELHSIEMEKAFIKGEKALYTDNTTGKTVRTTGGLIEFIDAGNKGAWPDSGAVGPKNLATKLENIFRYTSNREAAKLALVGSGVLNVLNQAAQGLGTMNTVAADEAFGMNLMRWVTPFGTLYLKSHPLFTMDSTWRNNMVVIDVPNIKYRYIEGRDTQQRKNVQANDEDARRDEFFSECGLEVNHPTTHHYYSGITSYDSTK